MTTQHDATVEDEIQRFVAASGERSLFWSIGLDGGDLQPQHRQTWRRWRRESFASLNDEGLGHWVCGDQHLYEVFRAPRLDPTAM
jgi:hypothetical protein